MSTAELFKRLSRVWHCEGGNAALVAGLCAFPLLFAVTSTLDTSAMINERFNLQAAADAGALAGASKLALGNDDMITAAATSTARKALQDVRSPVELTVSIDHSRGAVTLKAVSDHKRLIGFLNDKPQAIAVQATAEGLLKTPLCVLQIGDTEMKVDDKASIRAGTCLIHGNRDISVAGSAMIQAVRTQAVGKVKGPVSPQGHSGAMTIADPFASMDLKPPTTCAGKAAKVKAVKGSVLSLPAGVHCDYFKIEDGATLLLQPGEHYFMDHLETKSNAVIRGDDVVLVFGADKSVKFGEKSSVQITARKTGPLAGFLITTTRDNDEKFVIAADNVSELLGTIYIPNAELEIETAGQVAEDSAWSIIVAKTITMKNNPTLVINTRYAGSGVPVPSGVGPSSSSPRLSN